MVSRDGRSARKEQKPKLMINEYMKESVKNAMDAFVKENYPGVIEGDAKLNPGLIEQQIQEDTIRSNECSQASRFARLCGRPSAPDIATAIGKKGLFKRPPLRELLKSWMCRLVRYIGE